MHDIQEAALARIETARRDRKQGRMTRAALFTQVHMYHASSLRSYAKLGCGVLLPATLPGVSGWALLLHFEKTPSKAS